MTLYVVNLIKFCETYPIFFSIIGIIALSIGSLILFWGRIRAKKLKLILSTPPSKIQSVSKGIVATCGKVQIPEGLEAIKSPFKRDSCIYYAYQIMKEAFEQSSSGDLDDGNWVWKEAVYGEKRIDFYLEDDTGRIRIDMESADIFGMPKTVFSIEYDKIRKALRFPKGPMDAETEFFCKLLDSRTKELLLGSGRFKELKFKEFSLSDQGELYVVGYADFYQPQESDQIRDEKELIIKNAIYVSDVPRGIHIGKLRVQMGIGYFFGSLFFISGALIVLTSWGFF